MVDAFGCTRTGGVDPIEFTPQIKLMYSWVNIAYPTAALGNYDSVNIGSGVIRNGGKRGSLFNAM